MGDLGHCEHPECDRLATRSIQLANMVRAVECCEQHAADFRECAHDACQRLAQVVMAIGARDQSPRTPKRDELWLCPGCAEKVRQAPSVTLNGRRYFNDRAGWLIPLPPTVGRG